MRSPLSFLSIMPLSSGGCIFGCRRARGVVRTVRPRAGAAERAGCCAARSQAYHSVLCRLAARLHAMRPPITAAVQSAELGGDGASGAGKVQWKRQVAEVVQTCEDRGSAHGMMELCLPPHARRSQPGSGGASTLFPSTGECPFNTYSLAPEHAIIT